MFSNAIYSSQNHSILQSAHLNSSEEKQIKDAEYEVNIGRSHKDIRDFKYALKTYNDLFLTFSKYRDHNYSDDILLRKAKTICIECNMNSYRTNPHTLQILSERNDIESLSIIINDTIGTDRFNVLQWVVCILQKNKNISRINYLSLSVGGLIVCLFHKTMKTLADVLSDKSITTLSLNGSISDINAATLAVFLECIEVYYLSLKNTRIGKEGLDIIINALRKTKIKSIDLTKTGINECSMSSHMNSKSEFIRFIFNSDKDIPPYRYSEVVSEYEIGDYNYY